MRSIIALCALIIFSMTTYAKDTCPSHAVACGTPEVYKMIFTKFEVSHNSGDSWITVADTPVTVDLAAIAVGAVAGSVVPEGTTIADGFYDWARSTISTSFTVKGFIYNSLDSNFYYTTATGQAQVPSVVIGGTTDADFLANEPGDYGNMTITPPSLGSEIVTLITDFNLTVSGGSTPPQAMLIDVKNTLELINTGPGSYSLFPGEPVIDIDD